MKNKITKEFRSIAGVSGYCFMFIFLVLTSFSQSLWSQDLKKEKQRYLGLGFNLSSIQSNYFRVNLDPSRFVRAEVSFGANKSSDEEFYQNSNGELFKVKLNEKSSLFGIGLYATLPYEQSLFYAGLKYQQNNYSWQGMDFSNGYYVGPLTNKENTKAYGPVLAAEYRFGNRFAVGGELFFNFATRVSTPGSANSTSTENKTKALNTILFVRFFPF